MGKTLNTYWPSISDLERDFTVKLTTLGMQQTVIVIIDKSDDYCDHVFIVHILDPKNSQNESQMKKENVFAFEKLLPATVW